MYHSYEYKNRRQVVWGQAGWLPNKLRCTLKSKDVRLYNGESVNYGDRAIAMTAPGKFLCLGDAIWLISYIRDWYRYRGHRHCEMHVSIPPVMEGFFSTFFPKNFKLLPYAVDEELFDTMDHVLPALIFVRASGGGVKGWVNNHSIVSNAYACSGLEFDGFPDWGEFAPDSIMHPPKSFFKRLGIKPKQPFVFLHYSSNGESRSIPPETMRQIVKHLGQISDMPVYIVEKYEKEGSPFEDLPNVVNLAGKTSILDAFTLGAQAELIIGPDSYGVHLGESFRKPTVCILGSTPVVHVGDKYKFASFVYGSGICIHMPCSHTTKLPKKTKCPSSTLTHCAVLDDINLDAFDVALNQTYENVRSFHTRKPFAFSNLGIDLIRSKKKKNIVFNSTVIK